MKKLSVFIVIAVFTAFISCADTKKKTEPEWEYLFNGEDFTGWFQLGGDAIYEIDEDAITGISVLNTPNSFLCTDKSYSDFILELEFKVDPSLNSGIQIRSHSIPEYRGGRVHGYQVEIDPSDRAWSAGIYDEARRGWLYPLNEPGNEDGRKAFKNGEWNKIRVEALGNHIKTWLNGVPVSNMFDEQSSEGFIALQVHSIRDAGQEGTQVAWRDIRIITGNVEKYSTGNTAPERSYLINNLTENEKSLGWRLLFDGVTSEGWRRVNDDIFPEKGWVIENGILTVQAYAPDQKERWGDIITIERFSDFDLSMEVKLTEGANSGVKYFVVEKEGSKPGTGLGLEYQILDDSRHPDADKGHTQGIRTFAALYDIIKPENRRLNAIGEWNNIRIVSKDKKVEHWLNGFKVLEFERGSPEYRELISLSKFKDMPGFGEASEGHILLQDHRDEVSYRSIKIREL